VGTTVALWIVGPLCAFQTSVLLALRVHCYSRYSVLSVRVRYLCSQQANYMAISQSVNSSLQDSVHHGCRRGPGTRSPVLGTLQAFYRAGPPAGFRLLLRSRTPLLAKICLIPIVATDKKGEISNDYIILHTYKKQTKKTTVYLVAIFLVREACPTELRDKRTTWIFRCSSRSWAITITCKRNGALFSARQNFGWQLWICSRGEGGWKAVIGQTPRNALVTQA